MAEWWSSPYPGGPLIRPSLPRRLYPPDADGYPASVDGPDALAWKRSLARGGRWPWNPISWDDTYSNAFAHGKTGGNVGESGVAGFQRQMRMDVSGWVGVRTYNALRSARIPQGLPHAGEPLIDSVAADLFEQAYHQFKEPSTADKIEQIKRTMQDYMRRALLNARNWHYVQRRPMRSLGDDPSGTVYSDCSEGVTAVFYWASRETGYDVPDPNGFNYSGLGNTDTLWQNNDERRVGSPFTIGDLALYYAGGGHVAVCMTPGTLFTSRWWTNGSEGGPYQEDLNYRSDLKGVVRPILLA